MIVIASGYFDPLHIGHLEYLKKSKELAGDNGTLIVIVNNDVQTLLKNGYLFLCERDRIMIVEALRYVDEVVLSIDTGSDVNNTLHRLISSLRNRTHEPILFAKGGDRKKYEIPEAKLCEELEVSIVDGLGEKIRSSSDLLKNWNLRIDDKV